MLMTEYRVPLPVTIEEYEIGRLFTINEMYKQETGGGEGVEVLINEPFTNSNCSPDQFYAGQYTYKIYHLSKKVPWFIRKLAPHGIVKLHEESWNSYPYCKTELNVYNLDEGFSITIQTHHIADNGGQDNVHGLSNDQLKKRNIIGIDIVNDNIPDPSNNDPTKFKSIKGKRGPIVGDWIENHQPIMTCYKLVTAEFQWFGLKPRIEKLIQSTEKKLIFIFHRMLLCSMDKWYDLCMSDIRNMEKLTAIQLHRQRFEGTVQGMIVKE